MLEKGKKIYFASDFHLGAPNEKASKSREKKIIAWLNEVSKDAAEIYLVGDVFDFWFEYTYVIPKGFVRLQGAIAALTDAGIPVHFFTGNHDMWTFGYLQKELGVIVHTEPIEKEYNGVSFYIGHGDGLGPGDYGYKFIKKVFQHPLSKCLFARLHPNFGFGLANYFSKRSRVATKEKDEIFLGNDKEWLAIYCLSILKQKHIDYFIFGHRHLPLQLPLMRGKSKYINLGEWLKSNTYAVFDGTECVLKKWEKEEE